MSESELINNCIQKDPVAWGKFVTKYSRLIFIAIENRLKKYGLALPYQEIEDIRQNILASLWKENKLQAVKNRNDISYWLAIVSGNAALNYIRSRRQELFKSVSLFKEIDGGELAEIIPSLESPAPDELTKNEISKRIEESIESLPSKEKLIIKLNIVHGKKYYEISDLLGLPKGTVSNYIKRGREKLKEALKDIV